MATVLKIGPDDHGRRMTFEEYLGGDYEEGYKYELIDGKLYVSPQANTPQGLVERWISRKLDRYTDDHPEVINVAYNKTRVFVPGRPGLTVPEPDLAAYHDFPLDWDFRDLDWANLFPVLVVEVLSADDPDKDLVRNVTLYLHVPTIREYWILDPRNDPNRPTMMVYRRRGSRWQRPIELAYGDTYATKLLPGFELVVDPRR